MSRAVSHTHAQSLPAHLAPRALGTTQLFVRTGAGALTLGSLLTLTGCAELYCSVLQARTETYRQALECNPSLIRGKAVMDVGCGTGILSLFACRAGAAQVVAIDGSERIAGFAR